MKSSIKINKLDSGIGTVLSFGHFLTEVWELSKLLGEECEILLQHSLRHDEMGVSVEFKNSDKLGVRGLTLLVGKGIVGLYGAGKDFETALAKCVSEIREFKKEHGPQQAKESAPRTKSRSRHRRQRATRKRRS